MHGHSSPATSQLATAARPTRWGLWVGFLVLGLVLLLPRPEALPIAGHRMLAVFAFALIVWLTEAVEYAVSAVIIAALMAFLLGTAPNVADPTALLGTQAGLAAVASGFANGALTTVAAALFLAAAMTITGLDRRIALFVLAKVGARTRGIVVGAIVVSIVLAFLVPSGTARAAALIPIMLGVIAAFGVPKTSRFAGLVVITTVQTVSIWNVGVKTAGAQNFVAVGFIQKLLKSDVTWIDWLIAGAPYALVLSVALYFIMMILMPPEMEEVAGGDLAVKRALAELGPMTGAEVRLLAVSLVLLCFWATETILHKFDTATTTTTAVAFLLLPGLGVMDWKRVSPLIPWGTIVLFGVGLGLGTALLSTQAAQWLAQIIVTSFGLNKLGALSVLAVMAAFLLVIHLGFASAAALAASMIPIVIAVLQKLETPGLSLVGLTLILQFVVSLGLILPVNTPQSMVAYGTGTFSARDFIRVGLALTIAAYLLLLLFSATYWRWLGYT